MTAEVIRVKRWSYKGDGKKICPRCSVEQPLASFPPLKRNGGSGVEAHCKKCRREKMAAKRRAAGIEQRNHADYVSGVKRCNGCNEVLPFAAFFFDKRANCPLSKCKKCHYDSKKDKLLLSKYGITREYAAGMLAAQGGGCAICGRTAEQEGRDLAVDHDHKTGIVRGILCGFCNRAIGLLRDCPNVAASAAVYLRRQKS